MITLQYQITSFTGACWLL